MASMENGASRSCSGAGTWRTIRSNKAERSLRGPSRLSSAQPSRPTANRVGKSSCSSLASEHGEQVEDLVMHLVRPGVAAVDLVDHHDGPQTQASALPVTNLVCGIGPSAASTSTTTPSTIDRMRSTSPPKSA